jgi:antagonist of KipI
LLIKGRGQRFILSHYKKRIRQFLKDKDRPIVKVVKAGIQDNIQDMGRFGHQHLGINPSGAMDRFSASVANWLVGNDTNEAVIELNFPASAFLFEKPLLIGLSGADLGASVNGDEIPVNHPVWVGENSLLQFHKVRKGARAYLAVRGGYNIAPWLHSKSTNLKAKVGGYKGRSLHKDDDLPLNYDGQHHPILDKKGFFVLPWHADMSWGNNPDQEILVLPGAELDRLTDSGKETFMMTSFLVTNQSDRMGYRLNNQKLSVMPGEEMVSSGVSRGTIQLLPDGKLIVLMADHQTTGGYPRIAHVISAHHPRLAQVKAGEKIRFRFTDQQTAEDLYLLQHQHLQQLQNSCKLRLEEFLHALY